MTGNITDGRFLRQPTHGSEANNVWSSMETCTAKRAIMGIQMDAAERSAATGLSELAQKLLHGLCNCDRIVFGFDRPAPLDELVERGVALVLSDPIDFGGGVFGRRVSLHLDILHQL